MPFWQMRNRYPHSQGALDQPTRERPRAISERHRIQLSVQDQPQRYGDPVLLETFVESLRTERTIRVLITR